MMREGALERPIAGREGGRICSDLPRSAVAGRQARRLARLFVLKIAVYRRVFVRFLPYLGFRQICDQRAGETGGCKLAFGVRITSRVVRQGDPGL